MPENLAITLPSTDRPSTPQEYQCKITQSTGMATPMQGVSPWFWSKIGHFPPSCLGNIGQENVFFDILERKSTSLGYKYKKFKKSKN